MSATDAALAAEVAEDAGELLLAVREEIGFYDPYDLGDAGDRRANTLILDRLRDERPHDAVLSEEAVDDLSRVQADRVWIVDPVDGTHEFSMPGRTDWAVHVALWQRDGGPNGGGITDAAVALPARGEVYRTDTVPAPPPRADGPIRITASASRPPPVLWWLRDRLDIQTRADRVGGRQGDGRGPRRRRRLHPRRRPVGVGFGRAGRVVPAAGHARVPAGRLTADLQPARPLPARPADVPR